MRVLHFFKTYWPDTFGGIERTIHALAKGCNAYGVRSDVLSLSPDPVKNTVEFDGHMAHKAKQSFELASTGFSFEVFGKFRELSTKADIVHYHFPWPFMDVVHFSTPPHKPTIVTYHSDIVKQKALGRIYKPLMLRFLSNVDQIVATSPNYLASSEVLQRFKHKTSVIPLGLDAADSPSAERAEKEQWQARFARPFLLFVGVLRYYKGIHILLEAATDVVADIVIVGGGPMEAELKARATELDLKNIHFVGAVSDSAKAALLELCVAVVFPSHLRSEAFGLSLVEAERFGKPMISCEIGTGTSYVNLDGVTGIVVAPGDPQQLAKAMNYLIGNNELARRYGAAAFDRYKENFTAAHMVAQYIDHYRQLKGD
ncbi:glycosyltransferase family 4 protein [Rhizobium sp. BR 314]|uniref:glycosyltransferase family 4 protein n=1 Tax=Rhizobium sp. BR 314 TaxID=3040013 RepID=UPI0039BFDCE2